VTKSCPAISWRVALLACATLTTAPALVLAGEAPPVPPAPAAPPAPPSAAVHPDGNSDLEAQLETARRRLEQAAHEVARLSAQLSGSVIERVMPLAEPRAIIGVQLERNGGTAGARVREVSPGGPAAEAGIRPGDVLVAVNGNELKGEEPARQVVRIMRNVRPDSKVSVRVMRDGKTREYLVTTRPGPGLLDLADFPEVHGAFMFHRPLMDMELATLTPRLGSYFGSDKGVLVVRAPADGALKLEDGDVILAIDGREPASGSHATRILGSYQPGEKIALRILRQHKTLQLETTLPEKAAPMRRDRDAIFLDKDAMRLDSDLQHLDRDTLRLQGMLHDGPVMLPPEVLIFDSDDT
jgi:predicted metalloprotease with PDZ domain